MKKTNLKIASILIILVFLLKLNVSAQKEPMLDLSDWGWVDGGISNAVSPIDTNKFVLKYQKYKMGIKIIDYGFVVCDQNLKPLQTISFTLFKPNPKVSISTDSLKLILKSYRNFVYDKNKKVFQIFSTLNSISYIITLSATDGALVNANRIFKIKKSTYDIYSKNGASYGMYTEIERNKKYTFKIYSNTGTHYDYEFVLTPQDSLILADVTENGALIITSKNKNKLTHTYIDKTGKQIDKLETQLTSDNVIFTQFKSKVLNENQLVISYLTLFNNTDAFPLKNLCIINVDFSKKETKNMMSSDFNEAKLKTLFSAVDPLKSGNPKMAKKDIEIPKEIYQNAIIDFFVDKSNNYYICIESYGKYSTGKDGYYSVEYGQSNSRFQPSGLSTDDQLSPNTSIKTYQRNFATAENVIVCKLNNDGKEAWSNVIYKSSLTDNSTGYTPDVSGVESMVSLVNDKVYCFFLATNSKLIIYSDFLITSFSPTTGELSTPIKISKNRAFTNRNYNTFVNNTVVYLSLKLDTSKKFELYNYKIK